MASDLTRTISDTHRELNEKKGIVVDNLKKLQINSSEDGQQEEGQETPAQEDAQQETPKGLPASEALKVFFDRIPLSSIPGLENGEVLEIHSKECIGEAIKQMYQDSVMGAPVSDETFNEGDGVAGLSDPYIGLIEFSSMVLWALEGLEKAESEGRRRGFGTSDTDTRFLTGEEKISEGRGFFRSLQQHYTVWDTKVAAMARSFRWGPFLPVRPEDTLLHALLMLSKHSLKAVPVVGLGNRRVRGFITQDAAIQLLLQCSGLEWFDAIADKQLQEFRFEVDEASGTILHIDSNKSVLEAMMSLWKHRVSGMPITDSESKKIVGNIRTADVRLLLDRPDVFEKRRSMSLKEFMKLEEELNQESRQEEDTKEGTDVIVSAAALHLKRGWRPNMSEAVTCTSEETLKELMNKLAKARADRSFLVDSDMRVRGLVTLRDIIIQFAPPLTEFAQNLPGFFPA